MTAALFIASKLVATVGSQELEILNSTHHLFLVYDPDGSLADGSPTFTNDEVVFRGGPSDGAGGQIRIEYALPLEDSRDRVNLDYNALNYTLIATGTAATTAWTSVLAWGQSIVSGTLAPGDTANTVLPYSSAGFGGDDDHNSNSTVASALASAGIDIYTHTPVIGGDLDGTYPNGTRLGINVLEGATTNLSGSQSNTFDGGEGNTINLFMDAIWHGGGSGSDIFYGGGLGVQVLTNEDDGIDTYVHISAAAGPISWTLLFDDLTPPVAIGLRGTTSDGGADTLYSIERIFGRSFESFGEFDFSPLGNGIHVEDLPNLEREALNDELNGINDGDPFIETAVTVEFGGDAPLLIGNHGTFIATNYDDTFSLNQVFDRTFYGENGIDTATYDVAGGVVFTASPASGSTTVQRVGYTGGSDPKDTFENVEILIGTDNVDYFHGTNGDIAFFDGIDFTLDGGAERDVYTFDLYSGSSTQKDYGRVTIADTDQGVVEITDSYHDVKISHAGTDGTYLALSMLSDLGMSSQVTVTVRLDIDSVTDDTGISAFTVNGVTFSAHELVSYFLTLSQNDSKTLDQIAAQIGILQFGTVSDDSMGGSFAADVLAGGPGNDTYTVNDGDDEVIENPSEGTDLVQSSVSFSLGNNVENLTLTGSSNIDGTGNSEVNTITGNSGVNTLNGGAGADTMIGGTGNDTYVVDNAADIITENISSGTDWVYANISFTIAGTNLEHLALTGSGNIDATGNSGSNSIIGNVGNNTLDGGASVDVMIGGLGDDTYVVDTSDVITENASEGTDTVLASATYTLSSNIENLTLTGSSNIHGTGNAESNTISGNTGSNTLSGMDGADVLSGGDGSDRLLGGNGADTIVGGNGSDYLQGDAGSDTLSGGIGNDTYFVDDSGDVVIENFDEGDDTVSSSVNFTLSDNVEILYLTGSATSGTGNAAQNTLFGTSGTQTLYGLGGNDYLSGGDDSDADTLVGGEGSDTYAVSSGSDVIVENSDEGVDEVQTEVSYTLSANVEIMRLLGSTNANAVGNALNNTLIGNAGINSLDGGAGDDTYYVQNTGDVIVTANESSGTDTVFTSVTYTLGANLENITAIASAITVTGNSGNNTLSGSGGSTLAGAAGNDTYYVGSGDIVSEGSSAGTDTVYSSLASYTLTTNVENLVLTGTGNISGTGNTLGNTITGNSGNNSLDGGTGTDTLIGGLGDDTYYINVTADVVTESSGEGTDTVVTSVTGYTLASNVENLVLGGSIATGTGNGDNNSLTGNSAANTLNGGAGADVLDGLGGNDVMNGGLGDDVFYVDSTSDNANENASEGTDTVYASVTYTLNTGSRVNVENLILTGANINGTGNSLVNSITGSSGNNTLDGGTGADVLAGGAGDDTYVVDDASETLTENASEGTDTVQSSLSWTLGSNFENLTLSGSSNIHGTGNSADNTITGNTGANSLTGGDGNDLLSGSSGVDTLVGGNGNDTLDGGTGNDTLDGGDGDDIYVVDSASDSISDSSGTDEVQSSVTYTLASGLENLTLTGTTISGTGNSANNYLVGSGSVNTLTGLDGNDTIDGGAGADSMIGGTGDDVYYISVTTDKVIENASEGTDTVITAVTGYTLAANAENLILSGTVANATGNGESNSITGNSANNSLSGLLGDDTYLLGTGGNDTINETVNGGGSDTLWITGGTTINDVTATTSGLNDIISYNGGADQVTLTNVNSASSQYYIETIRFDDGFFTTLMDNNTWTSGTSGADTLTGNSSHNVIIGKDGADTLDGAGGDDDIHGGSGNDVVKGGSGTDLLHGGTGNDSLYGQDGLDTMFGGIGLDTFVFEAATAYNNIDVIMDFNVVTDDDVLDLRDLLTSYNAGIHTLTDFVKVEDSGADSIVSIDRDGTGGTYGWSQVATLKGITGLTDEAALVSGGNLLAA